nr:DUF1963 domain-containing protein [Leptospira sp. B5-022]
MAPQKYNTTIPLQTVRSFSGLLSPADGPFCSSLGSIRCLPTSFQWPEYSSEPCLPICQINFKELSAIPVCLADIQYLWLFSPTRNGEILTPFEAQWPVIAISHSNVNPVSPIRTLAEAKKLHWYPLSHETRSSAFTEPTSGLKLGGHPTFTQSDDPWTENNSDQVLELDSAYFSPLEVLGDAAVLYLFRDPEGEFWTHTESC